MNLGTHVAISPFGNPPKMTATRRTRFSQKEEKPNLDPLPKLSFKIAFWIYCSWKDSGFIVAEDLVRRAGAFHCGAFHKALEIDGAVFAGEVAVAGPFTLDTSKPRVLSFFPIGVGAQQIGTAEWRVESRPAVPELRDAGEDRLQLTQELQRIRMHDRRFAAVARE